MMKKICLISLLLICCILPLVSAETLEGDYYSVVINDTWERVEDDDSDTSIKYTYSKSKNGIFIIDVVYEKDSGDFRNYTEQQFKEAEQELQGAFSKDYVDSELTFKTINDVKFLFFSNRDEEGNIEFGLYSHTMNDYKYRIFYLIDYNNPNLVKEVEEMIQSFKIDEQPLMISSDKNKGKVSENDYLTLTTVVAFIMILLMRHAYLSKKKSTLTKDFE